MGVTNKSKANRRRLHANTTLHYIRKKVCEQKKWRWSQVINSFYWDIIHRINNNNHNNNGRVRQIRCQHRTDEINRKKQVIGQSWYTTVRMQQYKTPMLTEKLFFPLLFLSVVNTGDSMRKLRQQQEFAAEIYCMLPSPTGAHLSTVLDEANVKLSRYSIHMHGIDWQAEDGRCDTMLAIKFRAHVYWISIRPFTSDNSTKDLL